jgi:adenylate cyclase
LWQGRRLQFPYLRGGQLDGAQQLPIFGVNPGIAGLFDWWARTPRWLTGLAIVVLFLFIPWLGANRLPVLGKLEAIAYDTRLLATQPKTVDRQVVVVDIDESSLLREGRFPWSRDRLALLVDQLFNRYQARAIGFDVLFSERDTSGGFTVLQELAQSDLVNVPGYLSAISGLRRKLDYDARFAEAMRGRPVVLAITFPDRKLAAGTLPPPAFTQADLGAHEIPIVPEIGYTANLADLERAAAGAGHIEPVYDSDGVVRRVPLVKRYENGFYPALALAVAKVVVEAKAIKPQFDSNGDLDSFDLGGLNVPVAREGTALVPYRGAQKTYQYFSAAAIMAGEIPSDAFAGAIVLVGTTSKGLQDARSTPEAPDFPGVEIHANLLSGILNGEMRSVPAGAQQVEMLVMLVAGLIVVFAVPWRRPVLSVLGIFGVALVVVAVNMLFWYRAQSVVPLAATMLMLLALLLWNLASGFLRESRAIRSLSEMFGEYVPRERVAQMRETGERFSMEGESRELSVLFSDVRDFTSVSEKLPPRELSALMNAYLTPMTAIIHDKHGTIDKYIGDAVMAFWGAPLPNPRHPHDAVAAALGMQKEMRELGKRFTKRGWPVLAIGVGVNTGPMNVGDMGSTFRKAYTVLGDAVNLAARLEGLTKVYGVGILCGEATRTAAPEFRWREVDLVRVKGKDQAVAIFEPLPPDSTAEGAAELAQWHGALALYRERRFEDALRELHALIAAHPDRGLYVVFRDRCVGYLGVPPPPDWDGANNFMTK